jgi:hypothetical protein
VGSRGEGWGGWLWGGCGVRRGRKKPGQCGIFRICVKQVVWTIVVGKEAEEGGPCPG